MIKRILGFLSTASSHDQRKTFLARRISQFLIVMGVPYTILFAFFNLPLSAKIMGFLFGFCFLSLWALARGYKRLGKFTLIIGVSWMLLMYSILLGPKTGAPLIFFPIISLGLILFERYETKLITIGCLIPVIARFLFDFVTYSPSLTLFFETYFFETISRDAQTIIYMFAVFTSFLFTFFFVFFYFYSNSQSEALLKIKNEDLSHSVQKLDRANNRLTRNYKRMQQMIKKLRSQQAMEADLAKGKKFQDSTLPQAPPLVEGLVFSHAFEPAKELSGDYFDYFLDMTTAIAPTPPIANTPIHPSNDTSTDTNDEDINWDDLNEDEEENPSSSPTIPVRRIGVVVADVVGKGVSASLEMFSVKTMLKLAKDHWFTPKALVTHLNELSTTGAKVFERHVPLIYLTAETHPDRSCTIRYVNAGHEYGIILRHNNPTPLILDQGGSPVAMDATETYTETQLTLHTGDVAFLFTDGCTDVKTPEGQVIGSEGFIDILKESTTQDPKDIAKYIRNRLKDLQSTAPQADDMTIVAVWVG